MNQNNLFPKENLITSIDRIAIKGHQPLVIWLTGLSGSGKSTIANALEYRLVHEKWVHTYLLDGDNIRMGLNSGLGFSKADRMENIRRIGEVNKLMYDAGLIVINSFISPYRADRDLVRKKFQPGEFWEIFVSCPIETCIKRDTKGLYQKALSGELAEFTGISSPYEPPLLPELILDSDKYEVKECVSKIFSLLIEKQIII